MSDPRDDLESEVPEEDDREDFAPLEPADLRGDENFADLPPRPDEPTGPGVDYQELDADPISHETE
jgi:hypothetical protein